MSYRTIRDMSQIPSKICAFQGVHFGVFDECADPPEMIKFVQELTRSRPKADREQEIEAGSLIQKQFALPAYHSEQSCTNDNVEFASHRRDEQFDDSPSEQSCTNDNVEFASHRRDEQFDDSPSHRRDEQFDDSPSEQSCTNDNVEFASHRRDEQFDDSPSHRRDKDEEYGTDISPSPSKKMKKETICKFCGKSYGKNFNRHLNTHLPDGSPEKIAWLADINPRKAAWYKTNYHENPEFNKSEKLRSVTNNENNRLDKIGLPPVEEGWTPDLSRRRRKKDVVLTPGSECDWYEDEPEFPVERSCTELLQNS
jgi:hypothetical protein